MSDTRSARNTVADDAIYRELEQRPCKLCGKPIAFVKLVTGSTHPVDLDMQWGDRKSTLVVYKGNGLYRVTARATEKQWGHPTHFGSCPVYNQRAKNKERK